MSTPERIRNTANVLFTILFLGGLLLPAVDKIFHLDKTPPHAENRNLAARPPFPKDKQELMAFPEKYETYFSDHFGFRKKLIRWHSIVKVLWLGESTSPDVVIGKDGWLFYAGNQSMEDYRGVLILSPQELETIRIRLENRGAWLAARNITYFIVVAPDKHTIYPEYMPTHMRKVGERARLDQILSYLRKYSHLPIIDLRESLLKAKPLGKLYFRLDTHWTDLGALISYRKIIEALSAERLPMRPQDLTDFKEQAGQEKGFDLSDMLALGSVLSEKSIMLSPKAPRRARIEQNDLETTTRYITTREGNLPRAVVFMDSFSEALIPRLGEHFSRAVFLWTYEFRDTWIEKEKPDIVIAEIVERVFADVCLMPNPPQVDAEAFAKKFTAATDTRLLVRPGDGVADWQALNSAEMIANTDHTLVQSSDGGPSLLLPAFNFPVDQTLLFFMDITSPSDTEMQLFYNTEASQDYSVDRVHTVAVKAGRQQIAFELPARKLAGRLRLNLGTDAGDYLIHSMEIRATSR